MLSDNQMISRRQASWIFMLNMLGAGLFSLTSVRTQVPSVSLLFSGLLTILVVIFYYMASFHIFEYYEKKTGLSLSGRKLPAAIILLWLMLYFPGLVWAMDFFRHVIEDRIPTAYGWMVPVLFLMAGRHSFFWEISLCFYGGVSEIETGKRTFFQGHTGVQALY